MMSERTRGVGSNGERLAGRHAGESCANYAVPANAASSDGRAVRCRPLIN
jgi:hypothetical protein